MTLVQYIKELLYQYECVIIPQLGAFLTQPVAIRIDREKGIFFPPGKELSFNGLLTHNDGLLANYIAQRKSISYENALQEIQQEADNWSRKLKIGQFVILNGIGELRFNSEQKIEFLPYSKTNFDTNSIGLTSFTKKPVSKITESKSPQVTTTIKKTISMEDSKKEPLAFTPEKQKQQPAYLKYAAVGVLAIGLLGATYFFGNQYLTNERLKSTEIAQEKIKSNVQEASFDIGELATLELNVIAEEAAIDNTLEVVSGDYFSVIAGSYREESNALKMIDQLKIDGFDGATLAKQSADGLYRVAYGRFESKREAIRLYYFLVNSLEEEAWYLAE
ncbi:SPOR domain-containing protein [Flavobacteriaceae bacterium]|nr:SPOR domain-containing protein [Flavobacteriaceae bacterium]